MDSGKVVLGFGDEVEIKVKINGQFMHETHGKAMGVKKGERF